MNSLGHTRRRAFREGVQHAFREFELGLLAASEKRATLSAEPNNLSDLCSRCDNYGPWHESRCMTCEMINED
jgi:hypothetical protein